MRTKVTNFGPIDSGVGNGPWIRYYPHLELTGDCSGAKRLKTLCKRYGMTSTMASTLSSEGHPFAEPTPEAAQSRISDSTLVVGRNASLTIGKDSLIVLG